MPDTVDAVERRRSSPVPLGLLLLTLLLLMTPLPRLGRSMVAISNLLHAPAFFVVTLLLSWLVHPWLPNRVGRAFAVVLLAIAGAVLTEWLQPISGRTSSWDDLRSNLAGTAAAGVWIALPPRPRPIRGVALLLAGAAFVAVGRLPLTILVDEWSREGELPRLASFETPRELTRWRWQSARVGRTDGGVAHGEWALLVELQPARFPGVSLVEPWPDWTGYESFEFEVCSDGPLDLVVKIFDAEHARRGFAYEDRFETIVHLTGGCGRVRIPLEAIRTAPADREMDLAHVTTVEFYAVDLEKPVRIVLDDVRLR